MHIVTAFTQMYGGLYGGAVPAWQIDQITVWEEKVRKAADLAPATAAAAVTLQVPDGDSVSLPAWEVTCERLIWCLEEQERTADQLRMEENRLAAEADRQAAAAAAREAPAEAAWQRSQAVRHRAEAARLLHWGDAARAARVCGRSMLDASLPRHKHAAGALRAAGGARQVYRETRGGAQ